MEDRRHAESWAAVLEGARYERGRPGYPVEAGAVLSTRLDLGPGRRVADVAAGTGKWTRVLTATGADVLAIEPMEGMLAQLRAIGGIRMAAANTEHLPLRSGSIHAITVAQAFHWFRLPDAAHELRRVLAPGGKMATLYNVREPDWPRAEAMEEIRSRYERLDPRPPSVDTWQSDLEATGVWGVVEHLELTHVQQFATWEDFDARFASVSFAIMLEESQRQAMLAELRSVMAGADPIAIPLRTLIDVWVPLN